MLSIYLEVSAPAALYRPTMKPGVPSKPSERASTSPAPRLNETPRKRTNSALEVYHGRSRSEQGAAGPGGATVRVWRSGARPRRTDVAAGQDRGGTAVAAGEDLETVSRSLGVTAATLTTWRDAFLSAGEAALATRPESGEVLENERLKATLGEAMIERDLLHEKIAVLESGRPLARRRPR
jgi:transposase